MNYKTQDDILFDTPAKIFSINDVLMGEVKIIDKDEVTIFYTRSIAEEYGGLKENRIEKAIEHMKKKKSLTISTIGDVRAEFPQPQLYPVVDLPDEYKGEFSPSIMFQEINDTFVQMKKNSIAFVGKNGVGKTTLMKQFATLYDDKLNMAKINIDELLAHKSPLDFIANFKVYNGFLDKDGLYIFMIDHISSLLIGESNLILDSLKSILRDNNNIAFWINLTPNEYKKLSISKEWQHYLTYIELEEPSKLETLELLKDSITNYKDFYNILYDEDVLKYAINRADKYINNQNFPEKAFNIIDVASVDAVQKGSLKLEKNNIDKATSKISHVDIATIKNPVLELKQNLLNHIVGQNEAIDKITRGVQAGLLGIRNQSRPLYSTFGFGSSGVGKTLIAKMISQYIMGDEKNMLRIDMSQFENEMNAARLLGSPVGYKDFEKGGELTEFVKAHPHCVILLDEFEKASEKVQLLFLPILDDGKITDAKGDIVDFSNTIIIATSNAGIVQETPVGFSAISVQKELTKNEAIEQLGSTIKKELLNRFDDVIKFNDLDVNNIQQIAETTYKNTIERFSANGFEINVEEQIKNDIIKEATEIAKNGRQAALNTSNRLESIAVQQYLEGTNEL